MTGTFTIKRRKQDTPRPQGQSSQLSVLAALGIGVGRSSPHTGSKRGYAHLTDPGPLLAQARAQEWADATGRPLPPHLRQRTPLEPPAPLDVRGRAGNYAIRTAPPSADTTEGLLDSPLLTSRQRRRMLHKAGSHGERPAGYMPEVQRHEQARVAAAQARRALRAYWRSRPLSAAERHALATGQPLLILDEINQIEARR